MISKKDEKKCIRAALILEIIGRPPEHLTETLQEILKQMGEEKGVDVVSKKINEPIPMKEHKEFYTTFAEIEVDVEDMLYIAILVFKYMPAHVEIISPEIIAMKNNGWNDIFNELTRRLHGYDEIARVLGAEKKILENKLRDVLSQKAESEKSKDKKKEKKK